MQNESRGKVYAVVGVGGRSKFYTHAMIREYAESARLAAICDANPVALEVAAADLAEIGGEVSTWAAEDFDRMIETVRPDVVLVVSKDSTHDKYICRAMELGCDVVTEKPMTIDAERCRRIIETRRRTGRKCRVTFNYRYMARSTQIKELLMQGVIGAVNSVVYTYNLGLIHGPFYFNRWHGEIEESGSLFVHKATHHFDLVNFWLGANPVSVFAKGRRNYFHRAMAERMGLHKTGPRCSNCLENRRCPFYNNAANLTVCEGRAVGDFDPHYFNDLCVFRDAVNIPDTMHAMVEYDTGALLNYNLITFGDSEYMSMTFHGAMGRLESNGDAPIRIFPHNAPAYDIPARKAGGGHGGGDNALLRDLFAVDPPEDPCRRAADERAGAMSILIGIAAAKSMNLRRPVEIADLVPGLQLPDQTPMPRMEDPFPTAQVRSWIDRKRHEADERRRKARLTEADTFTAPAAVR